MPPQKSPSQGSLIVAALIVLGIVFAGHWIVSYVRSSDPWAIIPWYGVAAVLIIVVGNLRRGSS
jgi:FtsH-binding integral membrane protein